MSTRGNIVVRNAKKTVQAYRHYDNYCSGTGANLQSIMNDDFQKIAEDERKVLLSNPVKFLKWLCTMDEGMEYEGELNLHGDIEYLYVIDLDTQTITCFNVCMWDCESSDEDFVNGTADKIINSSIGGKRKEQVCIYELAFDAEPTDEEFETWNEVSCYDVEEEDYEEWETSDLEQYVMEEATVADVLNAADCELCEEDYHHFLVMVTKYMKE